MKIERELSIYKANLLYLLLALVFLVLGGAAQSLDLFFGILVTEVLIIAIPSVYFVKRNALSLRKSFRLNRLGFKNIVLIVLITVLTYPIAVFFQAIFVTLLDSIVALRPNSLPEELSKVSFLWSVFFVAIVPGVCEEIMFRGTMLRAYEKLGMKKAIVISGVLFAMFHFALINFVGPLILGIVFGIMVYKTNSIYSSMLAHVLNNFIALVLNYFLMGNMDTVNEIAGQEVEIGLLQTLVSFAILGIFIFALINIVKNLLNNLKPSTIEDRDYMEGVETEDRHTEEGESINFLSYMPIAIVAIMFFIFNLNYS